MSGYHEDAVFPTLSSWGSGGTATFDSNVIETSSRADQVVARHESPRREFDVSARVKTMTALSELLAFFYARGGSANGFPFKDFADFTSHPTDPSYVTNAAGESDQLIGTGDGSTTTFQLVKRYTSASNTHVRVIYKPVSGSVRVWVNGVEAVSGWTVNTATGVVTFTVAPTAGHAVRASFRFYVPVRFSRETDAGLPVELEAYSSGAARVRLIEIMEPSPGYVSDQFYGGARAVSIGANASLDTGLGLVQAITATTTGLSVSLPDPASIPTGGPIFELFNPGSNAWALKDHAAATLIASIAANAGCSVVLGLDASGNKVWIAFA